MLAALLHDIVKGTPDEEQHRLMMGTDLFPPSDEDLEHPQVWHGMAAVTVAREELGIEDEELLEAVAFHTTGKPGLRPLGLVLYVADFLEPSRSYPGVHEARAELLGEPMYSAARGVADRKLRAIQAQGHRPHNLTLQMQQWLEGLAPEPTHNLKGAEAQS